MATNVKTVYLSTSRSTRYEHRKHPYYELPSSAERTWLNRAYRRKAKMTVNSLV